MGRVQLDLDKAFKHHTYGDLIVVFTWVNDERAMVLIPRYRKLDGWYIVCESASYEYDDKEYLKSQCMIAAEVLGMEPSPNNWIKLATIIHDALPDLITMPSEPEPEKMRGAVGEMKLVQDGQILGGQEIRLDQEAGVSYGA